MSRCGFQRQHSQIDASRPRLRPHKQSPIRQHRRCPADFAREEGDATELLVAVGIGSHQDYFPAVVEHHQLAVGRDDLSMSWLGRGPADFAGKEVHGPKLSAGWAM